MFSEKYAFFLEIAECGSVTKAADRLLISQSALSKYLRRLEESLNTQLFDRKSLPLKLTRSGEVFYRYVTQCMDLEKQCMTQIENLKENVVETLRIGVGPWRASCFLPKVLPLFQEKYPFVKLEILEGVSDFLADSIAKNKIDICLMGASSRYPFLEHIPLGNERILLVGSNFHPIVKQLRLSHSDYNDFINVDIRLFRQERLIMTTTRQGFAQSIENYFAKVDFAPTDVIRIENLQTGIYLTAQGNYFSFVPEIATQSLALPENISFFTIGQPELIYPISLTYNKNTQLSNAAKLFVDTTLAYYNKL
ncbi:LysR family transcriptional regulator [Oscillibacter sp. MSJ-2]|uniref:LysR family transcriptional regulator n=1 Tax=Dysosmobacter acutus TaxID=2841504 RepID=A0ABS6FAL0_9FIRM|nr:LysR family transcriptional regulator [Dysosmobacter acutus]MBU5627118.1 LysR family transcriptional regulator [Dysosmobacter acutus]